MPERDAQSTLKLLRGNAPERKPNVRSLALFAEHTDCRLASLGFAARVDFDKLLIGTRLEPPYGQSPFAFTRGIAFEQIVRDNGYGKLLELLRQTMGFSIDDARIANLRDGYPPNHTGMVLRSRATRGFLLEIVRGDRAAPNLIDGAVLSAQLGGVTAFFEADALAARFSGLIHGGEVKSFPIVDGRADPEKAGAAFDQVAVYLLLTRRVVTDLGGSADLVSAKALLIAPKNVSLTPTLAVHDVSKRIERVARLLDQIPTADDVVADVPMASIFEQIAPAPAATKAGPKDENLRMDRLHDLADRVGTTYRPSCLASCGLARFCRERAFQSESPQLIGGEAVRLLPGIHSLRRAADLAEGAPSQARERAVAAQLARARRLYNTPMGTGAAAAGGRQ